ncbi:MAG: YeeE/YedE family protein [Bacillales bacterium]|nr:YeeE/YedE family protein [Bacillales bacterium]
MKIISAAVLLLGAVFLYEWISISQALLYLLGGLVGFVLYQAHFGFPSAWRKFILYRKGEGLRAHMIMLAAASLFFLPFLIKGSIFGHSVEGYVFPVGMSVLIGAFLFGVGMQLGDGCASGTLYHIGGGDVNGIVTLIGLIIGSVIATTHFNWWMNTPHFEPISFIQIFGAAGGSFFQLILLAAVFIVTIILEKRRNGRWIAPTLKAGNGWKTVFTGPWSLVIGGLLLAVVNTLVLMIQGKPWGITSAFALWGAKIVKLFGGHPEHWSYWSDPAKAGSLHHPLYMDVTTVMDISVMVGALLAAALDGRFTKPIQWRRPTRMTIAALFGGVIMGYGAQISFGCNIGSYFDGIASFSVHGWLWFASAYIGSMIGVKLRPYCAYKQ